MFHRVTHDSAAEYRCWAKNIGGETYKIIRVIVEGSHINKLLINLCKVMLRPTAGFVEQFNVNK